MAAESLGSAFHQVTLLPAAASHLPLHTDASSLVFPLLCTSVGAGSLSPRAGGGAAGKHTLERFLSTAPLMLLPKRSSCRRSIPSVCSSPQTPGDLEPFRGQGSSRCHRKDLGGDFSLSAIFQRTLKTPILLFSFVEPVGFSTLQEAETTIIHPGPS